MVGGLFVLVFVAVVALFMWAVIRADTRDEASYQRWYDDPRQVWNGGQGNVGRR